jgi:hypothetical protein
MIKIFRSKYLTYIFLLLLPQRCKVSLPLDFEDLDKLLERTFCGVIPASTYDPEATRPLC